jgi:hypothetical protein
VLSELLVVWSFPAFLSPKFSIFMLKCLLKLLFQLVMLAFSPVAQSGKNIGGNKKQLSF